MNSPFKMKYQGVPALMKKLVGNQDKLPENLKKAIEAAPEPATEKAGTKSYGTKKAAVMKLDPDYPEKKVMSRSKYKASDEDRAKFEQYKKKGGKLDIYGAYRVGFSTPEESKRKLSSVGKGFQRGIVPRG